VKKKATLFTSATLNGGWLLITIDTALWLHKSHGFNDITITCCSGYSRLTFFSLLLRLKNFSSYSNMNKIKEFWNSLKSSKPQNNKLSEVASFAIGVSDQAYLIIGNLKIKFIRTESVRKKSLLSFISLSYKVIVDYLNYFRGSALKRGAHLKYQVDNIYAGLHVLSEALRSDHKANGSALHCRLGILNSLFKLHSTIVEYRKIVLPKESISFICGPSQTYIYGFISRFIYNQGAYFIDTSGTQEPFVKVELKEKYYSRLKIYKIGDDVLTPKIEKISDYYKIRIESPWEQLSYMNFLKKKPFNKEVINLKGVNVILYLHSFTDAQYENGYDGYTDLLNWAFNTLSILNSNKLISKVIVKTHPGINPAYHPGDVMANKHLKSQTSGFEKVQWAQSHFNVKHIKSSGLVVGITHHGSVAEELVLHKIPVIASTHSPWGKEYKFGYWWNSPKEYEDLISTKSITELVVTKTQTEELYRYVMDRYFNLYSDTNFEIDSTWQDMLKINGIAESVEYGENFHKISSLISQIDPEEIKFKEYIATRIQRINSLGSLR